MNGQREELARELATLRDELEQTRNALRHATRRAEHFGIPPMMEPGQPTYPELLAERGALPRKPRRPR